MFFAFICLYEFEKAKVLVEFKSDRNLVRKVIICETCLHSYDLKCPQAKGVQCSEWIDWKRIPGE